MQFYGSASDSLVHNVAQYFADGIRAGSAALLVATPEHVDAILAALPATTEGSDLSRAIVCLDARTTLDQFMVEGYPDWRRFEQTVGSAVRMLRRTAPGNALRVYGEMVGLLWLAGETDAAVCLEKFWNVLLADDDFTLFCGYPIDVFASDFRGSAAGELICTHSKVLYDAGSGDINVALDAAMCEVLGSETDEVRTRIRAAAGPAAKLAPAEAAMLWLRENVPHAADDILTRARTYYRECA